MTNEHPYPPAFRSGDLVSVSGRLGVTETGALVPGGFDVECPQAFANLDAALRSVGATRADVVKVVVYLTDIADRDGLNRVYEEFFSEPRPARTCVGVASLPYGGVVEVEALARVRDV
ncbi:RidA family protein [Amycolatopsis keratiniphila]|uniref:RidA family protein n=1 Tax=Amycolatopsis keratiniphila TaxID=129921 RepID=UPI000907B087|nr:Rid family hydrolase [Amycolatopsis keratiniphila]OLZ49844.1 reactive intermediate/imine deaminase [Amycolatopsis keratiniphila subsp. nogabecina]